MYSGQSDTREVKQVRDLTTRHTITRDTLTSHPSSHHSVFVSLVTGVFDVLNETRVAHGLSRLASPVPSNSLPGGSSTHAPRIAHAPMNHMNDNDDDDVHMYDDEPHSSHTTLDGELDPAEAVETLFRRLGIEHQQQQQQQQAHTPYSYQTSQPHLRSVATSASSSSYSSSHAAPSSSPPLPSIHYPSLRTVLPSLSSSIHSTVALEEIHEPMSNEFGDTSDTDPRAASVPLLSLAGHETILESAYDSASSVICPSCAALIPRKRFQAHAQYWCQAGE